MLQFVHLTGPDAGKDQTTRRKVRSQAMRDFRRRQRAENERKRVASPQRNDGRAKERATSEVVLPDTTHDRLKPPQRTAHMRRSLSKKSPTPSGGAQLTFVDWQDDQRSAGTTPSLHTPETYFHNTSAQPSPVPSMSFPPTQDDSDERFESQAHIDQMFDYCKSYLDWLCPGINATLAAEVLSSRQDMETCPTVLAALCLASVGHLDAVRGSDTPLDYALYKARVFRNINERMKASSSAVSDETIGYLACLLSYEMSKGSRESILHLQGLQSIIRLKGGLSTFSKSLSMMLECLDLCHALMFDEKPILTTCDGLYHGEADVDQQFESCLAMFRLLRSETEDFNNNTADSNPYKQRLVHTSKLIQDVMDVIDFLGPIPDFWKTVDVPDEVAAPYQRRLEQARSMGLEPDPLAPDAHYLARIVYLRILLMYNLDVLRIHPDHPSNQATIDGLWDTARKISEAAWAPLPYLRLWILLAGATLAQAAVRKSFFKAHLVRCVFRMGVAEWHRARAFITRYIASKALYMTFCLRGAPLEISAPRYIRPVPMEQTMLCNAPRHSFDGHLSADLMMQPDFRAASVPVEQMLHPGNATPSMAAEISRQASPLMTSGADLNIEHLSVLSMEDMTLNMQDMYSIWPDNFSV
ncbi:hypothetical protein AMS68_000583 [Peltaster fructicola]|uniref:Transcription factor domain-containing protein n=1 Tax=Peltaster fructicola TaxID=286661 RepID=A0A6H0XK28_9PEZI|nr:hypothetical protein AMS68_000583 [Peltaster fructicola]